MITERRQNDNDTGRVEVLGEKSPAPLPFCTSQTPHLYSYLLTFLLT